MRSDLGIEFSMLSMVRVLCLVSLALALPACTEGGTVEATLPSGFLGDPDGNVVSSTGSGSSSVTADTSDASESDAGDALGPDVDEGDTLIGDVLSDDIVDPEDADIAPDDEEVSPSDADAEEDTAEVEDDVPCTPGDPGCGCGSDADCLAEDDGDLCNGRMVCVEGACVADEETPTCDQDTGNPCTLSACDPATGACTIVDAPAGTSCDDGDPCTPNDRCQAGSCVVGPRILCDDGNPCTTDSCEEGVCLFTIDDALPCDDGNGCTVDDACQNSLCKGTDSGACGCVDDADCAPFDDGDLCNGVVTCEAGSCKVKNSSLVFCAIPDVDSCGAEVCNPATGACEFDKYPNGTGCDDGDPCTVDDMCALGNCLGNPLSCEDGACHSAACDPESGVCTPTPVEDGTECAGTQVCSEGATCQSGQCVPTPEACPCAEDADCVEQDDEDLCNGVVRCVQGRCALDPTSVVSCVTSNSCQTATCDPETGECTQAPADDGTACNDGDTCTQADNCVAGECVGEALTCEGDGPCVLAECHPFTGCTLVPVGGPCDNGDGCTELSSCLMGQCNELTPIVCEASNVCVDAQCDPDEGACVETPNTAGCDDGDPCTLEDICGGGFCSGTPLNCNDGNPCTVGSCVEGVCEQSGAPFEDVLCNDGNKCTVGDRCTGGSCVGAEKAECQCEADEDCADYDDDDACTGTLVCSPEGSCVVAEGSASLCGAQAMGPCEVPACDPADGACSIETRPDGSVCALEGGCADSGVCQAGVCSPLVDPCDDDNPCTTDVCTSEVGCVNTPTSGDCDDDNACTAIDSCQGGVCVGEGNLCGQCSDDAYCANFDDDACDGTSICVDGICVTDPETIDPCPASDNPCELTLCDSATGECSVEPADGSPCDDGDPCTLDDVCTGNVCTSGEALSCSEEDDNPCAEGSCDPATGSCVYLALSGECDDGNPCTPSEVCQGGACLSDVNDCSCDDDEECETELPDRCAGIARCGAGGCYLQEGSAVSCDTSADTPCSTTACVPESGDCVTTFLDEGDACGADNACISNGVCTADGQCDGDILDCDDGNQCTVDSCDPVIGCVNEMLTDGSACDDEDECTANDSCQAGTCTPGLNTCFCFGGESDCDDLNSDGNPCTGLYICDSSGGTPVCAKQAPVNCPLTGQEPCKVNECNPATGQCLVQTSPSGTSCDDGDPCTVEDACVSAGSFVTCSGSDKVCDDGDDCTIDSCEAATGECVTTQAPNFGEPGGPVVCEDNDWCTSPNFCINGVCGADKCDCTSDAYCQNEFDSDDLCAATHACDLETGRCFIDVSSAVTCFDSNPYDCQDFSCDSFTGECVPTVRPEGTPCEDAEGACTINDTCNNSGACIGTPIVTCNDPTPDDCQDYRCLPSTGQCGDSERPEGEACSDANLCTINDVCLAGSCQGALLPCEDGNSCTDDVCSALEGCLHLPLFGECDDGDPCTAGTYCTSGECGGIGITDLCGGCTGPEDCVEFDDGDACNGTWICDGGTCRFDELSVVECVPEDVEGDPACYVGVCDPENPGCVIEPLPSSTGCDDGDLCTVLDRCNEGNCEGTARDCDDGDPCTSDSCNPDTGDCQNVPLNGGQPCDDGDECNGSDLCQDGECQPGTETLCACANDEDCASEGADKCLGTYVCREGQCALNEASVVVCPTEPGGCVVNTCVPETGECESVVVPDGTSCNDDNLCTVDDRCTAGACTGTVMDCTDTSECTLDHCDPDLGCVHDIFAGPCDDGDPCTKEDVCVLGSCEGKTNNCDDGNVCTNDICVPNEGCRNNNLTFGSPCEDDDVCTITACDGEGSCTTLNTENFCLCPGGATEVCDDLGNACDGTYTCNLATSRCERDEGTKVVCPEGGPCVDYTCVAGNCIEDKEDDGAACDDQDLCTEGDQCLDGTCLGSPVECDEGDSTCQEEICVSSEGCLAQHASGSCTDFQNCTQDDHCVAGQCVGVPITEPSFDFDDGDLSALTITTNGQGVTWQATGTETRSQPYALHAVNLAQGTMTDDNGPWLATATLPVIEQPFGAKALNLRFFIYADFETDGCEHQSFAVTVNGAQVDYQVRISGSQFGEPTPCESTGGDFLEGQVSLGNTYEGATVEVGFAVETFSATGNGGLGVIIDDVHFDWTCGIN